MWEIYFWLIIGFLIITGLCVAYWFVQRHLKQRALSDAHDDSSEGLTLPELRQMLKKGLINQEGFDKLKAIVIAEVNATTNSEKNNKMV